MSDWSEMRLLAEQEDWPERKAEWVRRTEAEQRTAELEAELERYRRIVPGTPATESQWVALVARAETAERKLERVRGLPADWRSSDCTDISIAADELESKLKEE